MLVLSGKIHHLRDFGLRNFISKHTALTNTMLMDMQHDRRGLIRCFVKKPLPQFRPKLTRKCSPQIVIGNLMTLALSMNRDQKTPTQIKPFSRDVLITLSVIGSMVVFWAVLPSRSEKSAAQVDNAKVAPLKAAENASPTTDSDIANVRAFEQIALSKLSPLKAESEVRAAPAKVDLRYHPTTTKPLVLSAPPAATTPIVASPVPPLRPVSLILADKAESGSSPMPLAPLKPDLQMAPPRPDWVNKMKLTIDDTNASIKEQTKTVVDTIGNMLPKF
eukprot:gene13934-14051_t